MKTEQDFLIFYNSIHWHFLLADTFEVFLKIHVLISIYLNYDCHGAKS